MFRAIKRLFIWMGLMAEKATENDAINQAVVERGIRDAKAKADKAHYANGQLAGQVALLKDQIKRQDRQREDLQGMLQAAAAVLVIAAAGWFLLEQLAPLLRPLLIAVFLAYVLMPYHSRLRKRVGAPASIGILAGLTAAALVGLAMAVYVSVPVR